MESNSDNLSEEEREDLDLIINSLGDEYDKLQYLLEQLEELKHRGHF